MSEPLYTIGVVAKMVGVPAATIRTWEERYGLVHPERTPGGHRLYSRDDVDELRFVARQIADGVKPRMAHRLLEERLAGKSGEARARRKRGSRLLILLAERDRYAAELSEYFLRTEGYDVELVLDATDAKRKFSELAPDLVIVELMISGAAGLHLVGHLKAKSAAPIVAVSPLDARDLALSAGADAFLAKPLEPLRLVSTVRDLLGSSAFARDGDVT
ncbi:MAG: MerR family transcriptional regulator [Gaiellaceae bacterium]